MANNYNNKRYYWMKLERNFFKNARIKKLRKLAGGDTLTIIYLKLCLLAIDSDCTLIFEGIEETIEDELALKLEEESDNIKMCLLYLEKQGMLEIKEDNDLQLINVNVGSETQSNVYKKEKKLELFQHYSNSIPIEKEKEIRDKKKEIKDIEQIANANIDIFNTFWKYYPNKKGKDKCARWFASHKVNNELIKLMLNALEHQKKSEQWKEQDGRFIPYPYTWLNQGRWKDEIKEETKESNQWINDWYENIKENSNV